jgi:integrase
MNELTDLTADQAAELLRHWEFGLRAEHKSPATIKVYTHGVQTYLNWCTARDAAPLTRTTLNIWITEMLDAGAAPGTGRTRQLAVRRFTAWLIAVGRLPADPFLGIKRPPQRHPLVTPLTDDELRALLNTCTAPTHRPDEPLHHRRDEAIIRMMFETGIRAGELVALGKDDVDLVSGLVMIRRGKGGRGRVIPIGPAITDALRRYLALRQHHGHADSTELWLGERGASFGYDGLGRALRRRAERAGIKGFHPHKLRHTAAHRWLAHGGSESGLMAIAGWTRTDMLVRYTPEPTPPTEPPKKPADSTLESSDVKAAAPSTEPRLLNRSGIGGGMTLAGNHWRVSRGALLKGVAEPVESLQGHASLRPLR